MLIARHRRGLPRRVLAAGMLLAAAIALVGCASTIGDSMPAAIGGLPENAPQRPATPPAYPSVHDNKPRDRSNAVLSGAEQKKLEDELAAARAKAGTGANRNP
jgi:hypothetical protein